MKRSHLLSTLALSALTGCAVMLPATQPAAKAEPAVIDGLAAQVNGDPITFSQVRDLVGPRERTLRTQYSGQELADKVREARKGALQDLIDRQLIIQEFKKKEYQIPPQMIDDRITTIIREDFGGDRQAFIRTLQAQGYTLSKFRDAERDKVIVQAMRYQNVKSDFIISPNKVFSLYTTKKEEFTTPEQVHLWMIAIEKGTALAAGESDPQKAMAGEIRDKLLKGAKFEQLAQMYSNDTSRTAGGDWGWVDKKTLNESLTNAAFKLDANKISPVLEQGNTYYILKVSERKSAMTKPLDEVRPDLEKKLFSAERERLQTQWIEGLRAKAFIKIF